MTALAFGSFSKSTVRSPLLASVQASGAQARKRWIHKSISRQAIIMPAMSPFMTEGTITRWKKKEGEAFSAGDILLQIASDVATVDVEAENPGIIGKILLPDGSTNVPVEKVIALVVKDDKELANLSARLQAPPAPPYIPVPSPPGRGINPSLHIDTQNQPFMPSAHRSPSLFELHTMEHMHHRGLTMKHARGSSLSISPPSPQTNASIPSPLASLSVARMSASHSHKASRVEPGNNQLDTQMDGATIRRTIASNLARGPTSATGFDRAEKCETKAYFDGIL